MRSGALLFIAVAVSGCYDDTPGARIVIRDPGFNADHVELFLSTRIDPMPRRVAPDQARPAETRAKLEGGTYFLDGPADGVTPLSRLDFEGGRAVWDLHADPENSHVEALVAVAFDADNTAIAVAYMVDVDVPTNETVAYILDLQSATQAQPSQNAEPQGLRVWLWRKTADTMSAACLGLEYSNGQEVTERKWLVPEDDTDCDEVEQQLDCDKFYWHADKHLNSGIDDANCFTSVTAPSQPGGGDVLRACKVGSRPCVDGGPPNACVGFTAPKYCAANLLCNLETCTTNPDSCMNAADTSVVFASFQLDQAGRQCTNEVASGPLHIKLVGLVGGCTNVAFTPLDIETNGVVPSMTHMTATGTYMIENFDPANCGFDISLTGTDGDGTTPISHLLALDVTLTVDHVILPLVLTPVTSACMTSSTVDPRPGLNESFDDCH